MKNKNNQSFTIILAMIACLLTAINIKLYISKYLSTELDNNANNTTVAVKKTDDEKKQDLIDDLKSMNERARMERYFGEYIDYIESGEYEKVYNLLYPEFKDNYFKTLEDFKEYVKDKYPKMIIVSYENIERQGKYYVLFVKIPTSNRDGDTIEQNIVIYEENYAEFYLSFSL